MTYAELESWSRIKGIYLDEFRAELLIRIDCTFRRVWQEHQKSMKEEE